MAPLVREGGGRGDELGESARLLDDDLLVFWAEA
jgi:hypothetical protein